MASTLFLEIAAGQALSPPLQIPFKMKITRIGMPSDWDPASPLTFQIAPEGASFFDLYHVAQNNEGGWYPYEVEVSYVAPGSMLLLPPGFGANVVGLKLRSGSRAAPVVQEDNREFLLVFEE